MKKILIIDYDQSSLASLQGILTKEGYQVATAPDGQVGWDKYNKESPDLVLMEAMLPKVHGFELCQRITSERNSQTTVFIMTGVYKDRVYRTEALRTYGAAEYFEKPLKMAELLASVETVLGKPTPRPEVEPEPEAVEAAAPARPVRETKPEPAPVEHRKREKPKSDDDIFSLPADLDRLSKEIPKVKIPAPVRHDAPPEAKYQALADELLKSVVKDTATPKATVEPKPANGNGNGNGKGGADIDKFLKSALAGLDFEKEKVKAPKPVPTPAPVVEKPKPVPTPPPAVAAKPKPAPPELPPVAEKPVIEPASKITLTPGDPGSDISPFFSPGKPKSATTGLSATTRQPSHTPSETNESAATTRQPSHTPSGTYESSATTRPPANAPTGTLTSSATTRQPAHEPTATRAVERPEPRHEPSKPMPAASATTGSKEAAVIAAASLFDDVAESKTRKGLSPLVLVGVGVVALAAVGFFVLKPKRPATVDEGLRTPQTVTQTNVAAPAPVEEAPAPKVEPAPVKAKPKPQAKKQEPTGLGLEAVIPASVTPSAPAPAPQPGSLAGNDGQAAAGTDKAATGTSATTGSDAPSAPPVKTEEAQAQGNPGGAENAADPATTASAPVTLPPAAPVNEGDLVELGAVSELPKLVKSVDPVYPSAAQRRGVGGSITVNALIDEKGNVIDTAILKGVKDDPGLARAAENAVKKWKFQPARKNGVAVKVWKSFVIAFKAETAPAGGMD